MQTELKDQRVPIMMEQSLLDQIDEFRFVRRIGSRGEAIRQLIKDALIIKEMPVSAGE